MLKRVLLYSSLVSVATISTALSGEYNTLSDAIKNGKASFDMRYRYERVDIPDSGKHDAKASTLRTRLKYQTAKYNDLQGNIQFENVSVIDIGGEYNSTLNGETSYDTIADPEGTELNMANIVYYGIKDTEIKLGRQFINFDNQRFVGEVGFRQNNQTFDAATLTNKSLKHTNLTYSFVRNVNTVKRASDAMESHLINLSHDCPKIGKLSVYDYLLDYDSLAKDDSQTYGIRLTGNTKLKKAKLLYTLEAAEQVDYKDETNDMNNNYSLSYSLLELGASGYGLTVKAGMESLEGDTNRSRSFQTPLATGHKFNGWADLFLTTPTGGLDDNYIVASYQFNNSTMLSGLKAKVIYHRFSAEQESVNSKLYGTETDFVISKQINKNYAISFISADFDTDSSSYNDTRKYWATLNIKF